MNKYPNITQKKTAELNKLKEQLVAAQKKVETSQAALAAAMVKSDLYSGLLTEAQARLATATTELYQSSRAAQNLESLKQSDEVALAVVNETQTYVNQLIAQVQAVATATLSAASAVKEMSQLISDRKASNPLISSDLVNRATAAVQASNRAVTLIINTLVSVTNALSAAKQSADTARIVEDEIKKLQRKLSKAPGALGILTVVDRKYNKLRAVENQAQIAAKEAKDEQLGVQDNLVIATNELKKAQAALAAAEAAVGSN